MVTALGPGAAVTGSAGVERGAHQPVAGVGDAGHAAVGDHRDDRAAAQRLDQLGGTALLVALEVGDDPAGDGDVEVAGQPGQPPGVLGGDDVGGGEHLAQPGGGVGRVAQRRADQNQSAHPAVFRHLIPPRMQPACFKPACRTPQFGPAAYDRGVTLAATSVASPEAGPDEAEAPELPSTIPAPRSTVPDAVRRRLLPFDARRDP